MSGHLRPSHSTPIPTNVRCCPNSCHDARHEDHHQGTKKNQGRKQQRHHRHSVPSKKKARTMTPVLGHRVGLYTITAPAKVTIMGTGDEGMTKPHHNSMPPLKVGTAVVGARSGSASGQTFEGHRHATLRPCMTPRAALGAEG
jgi:hypothetical protein